MNFRPCPARPRRSSPDRHRRILRRDRFDKSVTLSVDGKSSSAHSFGSTVADVLDGQDITVGARDQVVPSLGSKVKDGDTITVRYARKLVVTVDGVVKEYWTTATTVDAALKDLGLRADGRSSRPRARRPWAVRASPSR